MSQEHPGARHGRLWWTATHELVTNGHSEAVRSAGPPCRECRHFRPAAKGQILVLCHSEDQFHDFSCYERDVSLNHEASPPAGDPPAGT